MAAEKAIKGYMGIGEPGGGEQLINLPEQGGQGGGGSDSPWLIDVDYYVPELEIGKNGRQFEVLAWPAEGRLSGMVFDLDKCLYGGERGQEYLRAGSEGEIEAIAAGLGVSAEEAYQRVGNRRHELEESKGGKTTLTETVLSLGFSPEWWNKIRNECYAPENFLEPDPELVAALAKVGEHYRVAVASNSPHDVVKRALRQLGLSDESMRRMHIFGPDDLGVGKPDPAFYWRVAENMGLSPKECLSVGDRVEADGIPALQAGMGAVIVSGPEGVKDLVNDYLMHNGGVLAKEFDLSDYLREVHEPGKVKVIGLTGRAGAGKTTRARDMLMIGEKLNIPVVILGLDSFFIKSSKGRKEWLEEEGIADEERRRREDQDNWWDFDKARWALGVLKRGDRLFMEGVYDRNKGSELVGTVDITPDPDRGLVVIFEGVGISHLSEMMDDVVFIAAHPNERKGRLLGRDHELRVGEAAKKRFRITQTYEAGHFATNGGRVTRVLENSSGDLVEVPPAFPFV